MNVDVITTTAAEQLVWVFGYGSLIWDGWETALGCLKREAATLPGYRRSFDKLSQRNWGTKLAPCPTLNLQADPSASCRGMSFAFPNAIRNSLLDYLARREGKNFALRSCLIRFDSGAEVEALVAMYEGRNLCGDISLAERVRMVLSARGTDGTGIDYVLGLATKLDELGIDDPAVRELHAALSS